MLSRRRFVSGLSPALPTFLFARHFVSGQNATPVASPAEAIMIGPDGLLGMVPQGAAQDGLLVTWLDQQTYYTSMGFDWPPVVDSDGFLDATNAIVRNDALAQTWAQPDPVMGMRVVGVHQVVTVGDMMHQMTIYAGGLDAHVVEATLVSMGYTARETDGFSILERQSVPRLNSVVASATFNAAMVVAEDVVCFSSDPDLLASMTRVLTGDEAAILEDERVRAMITAIPDDCVNLLLSDLEGLSIEMMGGPSVSALSPEVRERMLEDILGESDSAVGPMPVLGGFAAGLRAGGTSGMGAASPEATPIGTEGRAFYLLRGADAADAEQAALVASWRINHQDSMRYDRPYVDLLGEAGTATVVDDVAILPLGQRADSGNWYSVIRNQDLMFLMPSEAV